MNKDQTGAIGVVLVDDHAAFRACISMFLEIEPDIQLLAEAKDGREAIEFVRKYRPDITLMDLQLGSISGVDAIGAIRSEFPDARIIVMTTYPGDERVVRAFKAGAIAYVLKSLLHKELLETIRAVHAGEKHIPAEIASQIAQDVAHIPDHRAATDLRRCAPNP